jgi:hypothetical protein
MAGWGVEAARKQLIAHVAANDRELAADLVYALRAVISAETRLSALDAEVGAHTAEQTERLARLELVLANLELELGV